MHLDGNGDWISPRAHSSTTVTFLNWADACSNPTVDAATASAAAPTVYPWSTTGLSPINPLDGQTIVSNVVNGVETGGNYSIINQHGYMFMQGVPLQLEQLTRLNIQ